MRPKTKLIAIIPVILFTSLIALASFAAQVKVDGGLVEGAIEDGITVYKGIPFATPPVDDLRWRPPQAAKSWDGVLKADQFGPACYQRQMQIPGYPKQTISEDCLYLNIWTPAKSPDDNLPVMVWIYGGAFSAGSTSMPTYSGEQLAKKGVVLVSIAYRLGPLGFLAHPELSAESENHVSGNYGLLDQLAGLKWVQLNIKAFGGDPNRVTIFGESAGGISVSMLAASPLAKGLFQRAICESGSSFGPARTQRGYGGNMQILAGAESAGIEFAKRLGGKSIAELRRISPEEWQNNPADQRSGFWPIIDGYVIVDDQYKLYQAGKYNDVPVLIGTNSDEGSMFARPTPPEQYIKNTLMRFGPFADKILELYPGDSEAGALRAMADIFRDTAFAWGTWAWAKLQSKTGTSKVFMYYFDQKQPDSPFPSRMKSNGAPHGAEIAYVFKHLDRNPRYKFTDEDKALSEIIATYWTNFAKNGDPNGEGIPQWPVFKDSAPTVMYLNSKPHTGPVPNMEKLKIIDEYYAWERTSGEAK